MTKSNIHSRFLRKYLSKQGIKGNSKDIREKSIPNIILNDDILNDFSLKSGARKECSLSTPLLFNVVFNVLATSFREEKERKDILIRKEKRNLLLFTDDMIIYIGNTMKYIPPKLLEISEFDKVAGYEIDM